MTFWVQSAVIIEVIVDVKTGIKNGIFYLLAFFVLMWRKFIHTLKTVRECRRSTIHPVTKCSFLLACSFISTPQYCNRKRHNDKDFAIKHPIVYGPCYVQFAQASAQAGPSTFHGLMSIPQVKRIVSQHFHSAFRAF